MQARIRQILGALKSDPSVLVEGKPASNSTRWVFDVEVIFDRDDFDMVRIPVSLLLRGEVARVQLFSFTLGAQTPSFYSSKVHVQESEQPHFAIYCLPPLSDGPAELLRKIVGFRVSVDVMHSMHR